MKTLVAGVAVVALTVSDVSSAMGDMKWTASRTAGTKDKK